VVDQTINMKTCASKSRLPSKAIINIVEFIQYDIILSNNYKL